MEKKDKTGKGVVGEKTTKRLKMTNLKVVVRRAALPAVVRVDGVAGEFESSRDTSGAPSKVFRRSKKLGEPGDDLGD